MGGRSQWRSGAGEDLGVYSSNNVNGLQALTLFSGPEGIELLSLQSKEEEEREIDKPIIVSVSDWRWSNLL